MRLSSFLFTAALGAVLAPLAHANVIFQANSADPTSLEVVVTSPITFTAIAANVSPFYEVHFINAWTANQTPGFVPGTSASTTASLTVPGPFSSTITGVAGIGMTGAVDANDLVLTWYFGGSRTVAIGDLITLGAGVYTLTGFLSTRPVPDLTDSQIAVAFNNDFNQPLSGQVLVGVGPVAVPEPATISLAILGLAGLALRRRRAA